MTHDEAFLQAMVETPDDDTPRLVYADWLEENGDADRAEFIRLQCELATLLDISHNPINDAAVSRLAATPRVRRLRVLAVGDWQGSLSIEGGRALAASPHLSELRCLVLCGVRLGPQSRHMLRERFGDGLVLEKDT